MIKKVGKSAPASSFEYLNQDCVVPAAADDTYLQAFEKADIEIPHSCGGMGSCGTCRILVEEGLELLEERNEIESEMAQDRSFRTNERLSCQTVVKAKTKVRTP